MTAHPIEQARENLAARYIHQYHKAAILRGDWDSGSLIAAELQKIEKGEPVSNAGSPGEVGE
jgi:hypothetical protein